MVELRKRKIAPTAPAEPAPKKTAPKPKPKTSKIKEAIEEKVEKISTTVKKATGGAGASSEAPKVGSVITLEGFGGEFETQDGTTVTLKKLVDESKAGVVIFTYPKASTPGCRSTCFIAEAQDLIYANINRHQTSVFLS